MSMATPVRFLDRGSSPHLLTLVAATAFGPLTMTIFLPSLPDIARHFQTDYAVAQLAVSLYLASTAFLQLAIGPASDRYGRRPVMLACFVLALLATLAGVYAPTIEVFLAARIVQAAAVAGMAIGRAVIRDMYETDAAASRIGYVTMAMTLAPMAAPFIGGYFDEWFGWQSTFWVIFGVGALTLALLWADLGETHSGRGGSMAAQVRAWPRLLSSGLFWAYSATAAFSSGAYFAYLGGAPWLASEHFGLAPSQFGLYFVFPATGYVTGNFIAGRYASRLGIHHMMIAGGLVVLAGMAAAILLDRFGPGHPLAFFMPLILLGMGNGIALPGANAGIVSVEPRLAGAASGLGGFLQVGGGAALSVAAGAVIGPGTGPLPLLLVMAASATVAVGSAFAALTLARANRPARIIGEPGQ
jgi:DHA1 family bicyclomycin/chloramphenicol resistance-like MFS transporter